MVNVVNAVSAGLAGVAGIQQIAIAQIQAALDATVNAPPSLRREAWVQAVGAVGQVGKGSASQPWVGLDNAVAGLGKLAADADEDTEAVPYVLHLLPGEYTAPAKPFEKPVVLHLMDGAFFAGTSGPIPASLPTRTGTGTLPALFGVVQDGAGPVVARPFSLVVGTGAYAPLLVYRGQGVGAGQGGMTLGDVPAATGATVAPTVIHGCVTGDLESSGNLFAENCSVAGDVDAFSCRFDSCELAGNVVSASGATYRGTRMVGGTYTGAALSTVSFDDYSFGPFAAGVASIVTGTPEIVSRAAIAVQGDTEPNAASPITITFPVPFTSAPRSVVVTPLGAADATTVYRVTAITANDFTLAHAGTTPTSWNWVAVQ